jgi:hypothetical protein
MDLVLLKLTVPKEMKNNITKFFLIKLPLTCKLPQPTTYINAIYAISPITPNPGVLALKILFLSRLQKTGVYYRV